MKKYLKYFGAGVLVTPVSATAFWAALALYTKVAHELYKRSEGREVGEKPSTEAKQIIRVVSSWYEVHPSYPQDELWQVDVLEDGTEVYRWIGPYTRAERVV